MIAPAFAATASIQLAAHYNRHDASITLDTSALRDDLLHQTDGETLVHEIINKREHLFAATPVFVSAIHVHQQQLLIDAIEQVIALPDYQQRVLGYAPEAACHANKARGVFFGFDFHVDHNHSTLIEINSNAGGMLLNAPLLRAQRPTDDGLGTSIDVDQLEQTFMAMFHEEWRLERGNASLDCIAIVDENPLQQFLYPEFLLFQQLFRQHGVQAVICDPAELHYQNGGLYHRSQRIDLIYNRLTDFGLQNLSHTHLRQAYLQNEVVITPHPAAHALYADKRNLTLLSDEATLAEWGVDTATRTLLLNGIAKTDLVKAEQAESLWSLRKQLFFKPAAGYGSKAAYRGDKITRRVFEEIMQRGDYVVQHFAAPGERQLILNGQANTFKFDLRHYLYQGQVQLTAARLYQGQTTNFRSPGGGFAPVVIIPCDKIE